MNLLDINKIILGDSPLEIPNDFKPYPDYGKELKELFKLAANYTNIETVRRTQSNVEFYESLPLLSALISDLTKKDRALKKELFYAMYLGFYIPGVPSELVAMIQYTISKAKTPNRTISSLDSSKFSKYLKTPFSSDPKIIKKVIDTLFGYETQLLSSQLCVENKDVVEIYISNIDQVLLCNTSIRNKFNDVHDFSKLSYDKNLGVVLGESKIPLRTLINVYGICTDDMDLRSVAFCE